jgi:hypothetical protein
MKVSKLDTEELIICKNTLLHGKTFRPGGLSYQEYKILDQIKKELETREATIS